MIGFWLLVVEWMGWSSKAKPLTFCADFLLINNKHCFCYPFIQSQVQLAMLYLLSNLVKIISSHMPYDPVRPCRRVSSRLVSFSSNEIFRSLQPVNTSFTHSRPSIVCLLIQGSLSFLTFVHQQQQQLCLFNIKSQPIPRLNLNCAGLSALPQVSNIDSKLSALGGLD